MKKINVLITCSGGQYAYSLVECFRKIKHFEIKVYGIDSKSKTENWFLDEFFLIKNKNKKKFIKDVLEICKKKSIKFVLPGSENETSIFSKYKKLFDKLKIIIPISKYEIVKILNDKFLIYSFLKKNELNFPTFHKFNNITELKKLINQYYLKKNILIKPRFGSGSKGIFLIEKNRKKIKSLLETRICLSLSLELFYDYVKKNRFNLKNYIIMEYYNNNFFDVDCFARNGRLIYCIPRERQYLNSFSHVNTGCIIKKDEKISNYLKKVVKKLNINGICDFDIVFSENKPVIIDSSSRLSGSVSSSIIANINFPELLLKFYFNKQSKNLKYQQTYVKPVINFVKYIDKKK